jgi:hypothetical protein
MDYLSDEVVGLISTFSEEAIQYITYDQFIRQFKRKRICYLAAKYGRLDLLSKAYKDKFPWNSLTCAYAVLNNHLECLMFAHEHGCSWNKEIYMIAAKNGHLDCLKYAYHNGCPWSKKTIKAAVENGHINCIKYACNNECPGYSKYLHLIFNYSRNIQKSIITIHAIFKNQL